MTTKLKTLALIFAMAGVSAAQSISSSTARHIGWGPTLPATCSPNTGDVFFKTAATIGSYQCLTANTWSVMGGSGSGTVGSGTSPQVAYYTGATTTGSSAGATATASQFRNANGTGPAPGMSFADGATGFYWAQSHLIQTEDSALKFSLSGSTTTYSYLDNDSWRCFEGPTNLGACELWSFGTNNRFFDLTDTFLNWGDPLDGGSGNRVGIGRFGNDGATATTVHTATANNGAHIDLTTNGIRIVIPNSGSPGTTKNSLAKIPAGSASVLTTSAADVISAVGVVLDGAGTTGSAQIGILGQFSCNFDNTATTAGDYVTPSSATAGTCHDAGAAFPSTGEVLGQVLSTHGACGSPPCGPYSVAFNTPDISLPGSGGSNGNNGNGNSNNGAKQQSHVYTCIMGSATGTTTLSTGDTGCYGAAGPYSGTINRVDILGNASSLATCSITVDVWKAAGAYPTSGNKISASAPATLSTAKVAASGSLSGWTTAVAAGDIFGATIASVTGCVYASMTVYFQ